MHRHRHARIPLNLPIFNLMQVKNLHPQVGYIIILFNVSFYFILIDKIIFENNKKNILIILLRTSYQFPNNFL